MWILSAFLWLGDCDSVLDLAGHQRESLLDVLAILSRSLEETHVKVFCKLLALLEGDSTLVLKVTLVADKDARDVVRSVALDFTHPGLDSSETFSVSDIVGDNNTVSALVV